MGDHSTQAVELVEEIIAKEVMELLGGKLLWLVLRRKDVFRCQRLSMPRVLYLREEMGCLPSSES